METKQRTKLTWIRKMRGLSQAELARQAGVSVNVIRHYEQRIRHIDNATGDTLWKLATALEVPMEALLEHDQNN